MYSHITQGSNDLARSIAFYDALLKPLGITRANADAKLDKTIVRYESKATPQAFFFVVTPFNEQAATAGNGAMIAFQANSKEQVVECYTGGMNHGGSDEGKPGPRPQYNDDYYGAYLRDPDGNKLHIVYHGEQ